jgi:hypothetical protein
VVHYEAYYLLLVAGWQVGVEVRMVSTHGGENLVIADSLAEQDGFEPPVPVVRSEAASSCQFQILHTIDGAPEADRRTTGF